MEVFRINEDSWRLQEAEVRCFLFTGTEKALLVDSGRDTDNVKTIVEGITDLPVMVVNTHADADHTRCNGQFSEVYMHPAEYPFYRKEQGRTEPVKPIWDGDLIDLGGRRFEVLHVPGHTPGSIALLDKAERILVGGDGIQNGSIFLFGPQRDLVAYLYSLEKERSYGDRFDWVYASHADFSVPKETIDQLIAGVQRMMLGQVAPEPSYYLETPIKVYDIGIAKILYDHDILF